MKNQWR